MNYLALLNHSYKMELEMGRLGFLAEHIFNFTTYEDTVSSLMAKKCLEVCKAINEKTTYDYISTEENNLWYLLMVNMPFFENKLDWGCSIRGAWWHLYNIGTFTIHSCGLYCKEEQLLEITFNKLEWDNFISAMLEFAEGET